MILQSLFFISYPMILKKLLTLFPLGGGRCVSLQLEFVSILTGLEFCGWKLYDNFILCIPQVSEALVLKIIIKNLSNFKFENFLSPFFFYNLFFSSEKFHFFEKLICQKSFFTSSYNCRWLEGNDICLLI